MSNSFVKAVLEQYPIAISYAGRLPDGASVVTGTISATDLLDDSDATATVLESATLTISGDLAQAFVQAGASGHTYRLDFLVTLNPGAQPPRLEDTILMRVEG